MTSLPDPGAQLPAETPAPPAAALRRLAVRDFRNIERLDLALAPTGLAVVGENGHGKTNLLEAIYYLQLLRSVRGARDPDLVRFGAAGFHVAGTVDPDGREVAVGFARQGKRKRAKLNGAEPQRLSDALGKLPSVIFSPGDVQLVAGAPSERRRYLDVVLALTSRPYLNALQTYRAALARRNAALRDALRTGGGEGRVAVWEPALAEHGAVLWRERSRWVDERRDEFAQLCEAIGERAPVSMRYATALAATDDPAGALAAALATKRSLDLRRGVTHAGPHRDDLELALGGRDLRLFGSAGQQRTAAIALRMLESQTLRDRTGSPPLLLLDDPFAELDARRAHRILGLLGEAGMGQVLVAVPREVDIPPELTRLERREIRDGVLSG
jgi:DNA replication and repair protein RecF